MDFTAYPNILAKINELGGIKQTVFNKAELQLAEAAWQRVTPKELAAIDAEIPYAQKVMDARMCRTFVMPTAVLSQRLLGIRRGSRQVVPKIRDKGDAVVRLTLKSDCSIVRASKGEKGWHRLVFGWMMT